MKIPGLLNQFLFNDIAIDLGTANTLIYIKGQGIVLREPSVVALKKNIEDNLEVVSVGSKAKSMLGRTPEKLIAIRPLKNGVISNFDATGTMIQCFFKMIRNRRLLLGFRLRVVGPYHHSLIRSKSVRLETPLYQQERVRSL